MTSTDLQIRGGGDQSYRMLVGDEWREGADGRTFTAFDPYSAEGWATVPEATHADVDAAVAAARAAFTQGPWEEMTGFDRATLMRRLADLLERDAEELAQLETRGNGKLLRETRAQAAQLPRWL